MVHKRENRGGQAPASCDLLGGASHPFPTPMEWRAQLLACRFCLPPSMAREVSSLLFGEPCHD
jgi:hypothetical protein